MPKKLFDLIEAKAVLIVGFLNWQKKLLNHQRMLKNPQETYQTAPKCQIELLTNSKLPSWFTKEQLQNAEVWIIEEQFQNSKVNYW